jgi:peptide/nickel transport system substrate-binding protein
MARIAWLWAAGVAAVIGVPAAADETPQYGGTLTYMIPADAPQSFDAHREETLRRSTRRRRSTAR